MSTGECDPSIKNVRKTRNAPNNAAVARVRISEAMRYIEVMNITRHAIAGYDSPDIIPPIVVSISIVRYIPRDLGVIWPLLAGTGILAPTLLHHQFFDIDYRTQV